MKKLRALLEISSFIVVGGATEKVLIPSIKKQVVAMTNPISTNPYYKTKPVVKTKPVIKPIIYSYPFYKTSKIKNPLITLKPSIDLNPFKTFMNSKEIWMEEHVIWEQARMGYSSWDRDPEFYGWVIWITKQGQFNAFLGWLKRLGVYNTQK